MKSFAFLSQDRPGPSYNTLARRLLRFVPALMVMGMIWYFSSLTAPDSTVQSYTLTYFIVRKLNSLFSWKLTEADLIARADLLEGLIRKLAHFAEYLLLALAIAYPFARSCGLKRKKLLCAVMIFCILYAVSDEFHQIFSEGRSPQLTDVLIDSLGSLTGMSLRQLFLHLFLRSNKHTSGFVGTPD